MYIVAAAATAVVCGQRRREREGSQIVVGTPAYTNEYTCPITGIPISGPSAPSSHPPMMTARQINDAARLLRKQEEKEARDARRALKAEAKEAKKVLKAEQKVAKKEERLGRGFFSKMILVRQAPVEATPPALTPQCTAGE